MNYTTLSVLKVYQSVRNICDYLNVVNDSKHKRFTLNKVKSDTNDLNCIQLFQATLAENYENNYLANTILFGIKGLE